MSTAYGQQYIREIKLRRNRVAAFDQYPFSLPMLHNFHTLPLHPAVTFMVGENGSGKSTLLEAIAVAWGSIRKVEPEISASTPAARTPHCMST